MWCAPLVLFASLILSSAASGSSSLCSLRGFDQGNPSAYFYSTAKKYRSAKLCGKRCALDSSCTTYAFGDKTCLHYKSTLTINFKADSDSPFLFFDRSCEDKSVIPGESSGAALGGLPGPSASSIPGSSIPLPAGTVCGRIGYDRNKKAFAYKGSDAYTNFDGCRAFCLSRQSCISFAFGYDGCYLYRYSVAKNVRAVSGSPYSFFDINCLGDIPSALPLLSIQPSASAVSLLTTSVAEQNSVLSSAAIGLSDSTESFVTTANAPIVTSIAHSVQFPTFSRGSTQNTGAYYPPSSSSQVAVAASTKSSSATPIATMISRVSSTITSGETLGSDVASIASTRSSLISGASSLPSSSTGDSSGSDLVSGFTSSTSQNIASISMATGDVSTLSTFSMSAITVPISSSSMPTIDSISSATVSASMTSSLITRLSSVSSFATSVASSSISSLLSEQSISTSEGASSASRMLSLSSSFTPSATNAPESSKSSLLSELSTSTIESASSTSQMLRSSSSSFTSILNAPSGSMSSPLIGTSTKSTATPSSANTLKSSSSLEPTHGGTTSSYSSSAIYFTSPSLISALSSMTSSLASISSPIALTTSATLSDSSIVYYASGTSQSTSTTESSSPSAASGITQSSSSNTGNQASSSTASASGSGSIMSQLQSTSSDYSGSTSDLSIGSVTTSRSSDTASVMSTTSSTSIMPTSPPESLSISSISQASYTPSTSLGMQSLPETSTASSPPSVTSQSTAWPDSFHWTTSSALSSTASLSNSDVLGSASTSSIVSRTTESISATTSTYFQSSTSSTLTSLYTSSTITTFISISSEPIPTSSTTSSTMSVCSLMPGSYNPNGLPPLSSTDFENEMWDSNWKVTATFGAVTQSYESPGGCDQKSLLLNIPPRSGIPGSITLALNSGLQAGAVYQFFMLYRADSTSHRVTVSNSKGNFVYINYGPSPAWQSIASTFLATVGDTVTLAIRCLGGTCNIRVDNVMIIPVSTTAHTITSPPSGSELIINSGIDSGTLDAYYIPGNAPTINVASLSTGNAIHVLWPTPYSTGAIWLWQQLPTLQMGGAYRISVDFMSPQGLNSYATCYSGLIESYTSYGNAATQRAFTFTGTDGTLQPGVWTTVTGITTAFKPNLYIIIACTYSGTSSGQEFYVDNISAVPIS